MKVGDLDDISEVIIKNPKDCVPSITQLSSQRANN